MTRPAVSALVLDGSEVKLRLEAERQHTRSPVHVDWVRFTVLRRKTPAPSIDLLFPLSTIDASGFRERELHSLIRQLPDCDQDASAEAAQLARDVCEALGEGFTVAPEVRKGHDFYRFRWSIERNGTECGWVGFLASGDSPRQQAQGRTLHANVWGSACTFASPGWNERLADLVDECGGDLTRCDLALDFFDGFGHASAVGPVQLTGLDRVFADYKAGAMDSGGKRLKCNVVGDWANGRERSFYVGSKEAGKQTNVYEKGDQLFGVEACCPWVRIELRYGNKLRVLSSDMLRRPADFFAGASEWHELMLAQADAIVTAEKVKTTTRLALETVEAEVTRNLRWVRDVAAPSMAAAFHHLGDEFLEFVTGQKLPGRLQKFNPAELGRAFTAAMQRVTHTAEGAGPAFA